MITIKKILCPLDLSAEHTKKIVDYAQTLAKALNAEVIACFVTSSFDQMSGYKLDIPELMDDYISKLTGMAEEDLKKLCVNEFKDIKASYRIVNGYPAEEILALAEKENVDFIVMGTNGRKGLNHFIFGSVAEKVVKSSSIPVMTIKP